MIIQIYDRIIYKSYQKMNKTLLFISLAVMIMAMDPPVFPEKYEVKFNQTAKIGPLGGSTKGTIFYDATNNRQVIARQNGHHDRYCGTVYKFADTSCNHYVVNGKRFLDFPEKKYCCYCCDSTHGCGIVTRDWLKTANATYQGTQKLDSGQPYMKWSVKGLQQNLYYHKNDTLNTPRRLYQGTDDLQDFYGYKVGITDESVFKLPSYCTDKCGITTICAALRNELLTTQ